MSLSFVDAMLPDGSRLHVVIPLFAYSVSSASVGCLSALARAYRSR
jgi:Flp pilus assembly CpaF family ATPase